MVEIELRAYAWVQDGKRNVKVNLDPFLKKVLADDSKLVKKYILLGLSERRRELDARLQKIRNDKKTLTVAHRALDKLLKSDELKGELQRLPPEDRRRARRMMKYILDNASSELEYLNYEEEDVIRSLNATRALIDIIKGTDHDLLDISVGDD